MVDKPNSARARDIAYFLHPYSNLKLHEEQGPLVITEGKGIYVYDEDGNEYIEGLAGLWCTALGFGEERLVKAANAEMSKLPFFYSFFHRSHDKGIDLAEKLVQLAPVPMSKAFFTSSGSEANDTAIKLIWYYSNARRTDRQEEDHPAGTRPTTVSPSRRPALPACRPITGTSTCRSTESSIPIAPITTASPKPANPKRISRHGWPITSSGLSLTKGRRRSRHS